MYLISHQTHLTRWISGVFQDKDTAIAYLETIPSCLETKLLEFPIRDYPVYLLESGGHNFVLYDAAKITAYINTLELKEDDNWCYGNIYRILRDWQSPHSGKDYMGMISHIHLYREHILKIKNFGISAYFSSNFIK